MDSYSHQGRGGDVYSFADVKQQQTETYAPVEKPKRRKSRAPLSTFNGPVVASRNVHSQEDVAGDSIYDNYIPGSKSSEQDFAATSNNKNFYNSSHSQEPERNKRTFEVYNSLEHEANRASIAVTSQQKVNEEDFYNKPDSQEPISNRKTSDVYNCLEHGSNIGNNPAASRSKLHEPGKNKSNLRMTFKSKLMIAFIVVLVLASLSFILSTVSLAKVSELQAQLAEKSGKSEKYQRANMSDNRDWFDYNGYRYRISVNGNWNLSRNSCRSLGGDLAMSGMNDNTTVRKIMNNFSKKDLWIGFHNETDWQKNCNFKNESDSTNATNCKCLYLATTKSNISIVITNCMDKKEGLCEKNENA